MLVGLERGSAGGVWKQEDGRDQKGGEPILLRYAYMDLWRRREKVIILELELCSKCRYRWVKGRPEMHRWFLEKFRKRLDEGLVEAGSFRREEEVSSIQLQSSRGRESSTH